MNTFTGTTTAATYHITSPCPGSDFDGELDDVPCEIAEMESYDQPTGELWCHTHWRFVGMLT